MEKNIPITIDLLKSLGFEEITMPTMKEYYKKEFHQDDYIELRKWTDGSDFSNVLKLDIDNGPNNRGSLWHLHIDNADCCSIGSADISYDWEFNKLMEIFESNFRL